MFIGGIKCTPSFIDIVASKTFLYLAKDEAWPLKLCIQIALQPGYSSVGPKSPGSLLDRQSPAPSQTSQITICILIGVPGDLLHIQVKEAQFESHRSLPLLKMPFGIKAKVPFSWNGKYSICSIIHSLICKLEGYLSMPKVQACGKHSCPFLPILASEENSYFQLEVSENKDVNSPTPFKLLHSLKSLHRYGEDLWTPVGDPWSNDRLGNLL